jgi:hypothetical protein
MTSRRGQCSPSGVKMPVRLGVLLLPVVLLAGCSDSRSTGTVPSVSSPTASGEPSSEASVTPSPFPVPSTSAQEEAQAASIPLEGTALVPLHWRLGTVKPQDAKAVLAVRRLTALENIIFSMEDPSVWRTAQMSVQNLPADSSILEHMAKAFPLSWEKRYAGPTWIWVMDVHRDSPKQVTTYQCVDGAWSGTVGESVRKRKDRSWTEDGAVERTIVSLLDDYPDGSRWKVTDYDMFAGSKGDQYQEKCSAWARTHTTTEGWEFPPTTQPPGLTDPTPAALP